MPVPALLISLNKAFAAPRWASSPELTGEGACIGGGGGGAGMGGGGAADAAPAFATAPCKEIAYKVNGIHVAMFEINLYNCTTSCPEKIHCINLQYYKITLELTVLLQTRPVV